MKSPHCTEGPHWEQNTPKMTNVFVQELAPAWYENVASSTLGPLWAAKVGDVYECHASVWRHAVVNIPKIEGKLLKVRISFGTQAEQVWSTGEHAEALLFVSLAWGRGDDIKRKKDAKIDGLKAENSVSSVDDKNTHYDFTLPNIEPGPLYIGFAVKLTAQSDTWADGDYAKSWVVLGLDGLELTYTPTN
jgi:hypothetical protein